MPTDTGDAPAPATLVVDGNNVMGAAADGWWRDRQGAVLRLAGRLDRYRERTGEPVVLVLDVPHPALPEGGDGGPGEERVGVRYPARRGRDAADDRIVALLDEWGDGTGPDDVVVVTSDRALADRVAGRGAAVVGAGSFLSRLRALGL
jgi:predicted RNA-binding protein with PIN domain